MDNIDLYENFANRYDWMKVDNPSRSAFFRQIFSKYNISNVLDCACGTDSDLVLFESFGCKVCGSDLSQAMLDQAKQKLFQSNLEIELIKTDFCYLTNHYKTEFDAVVCLANAINEPLDDADTYLALNSMKSVLKKDGILIIDQGQTDASMKNPPRFAPVINNRDFSRLFVLEYAEKRMDVQIFDFIHTEEEKQFHHNSFSIRIRLKDSWERLLKKVGFKEWNYYGSWENEPYNKNQSDRLIIVAQK